MTTSPERETEPVPDHPKTAFVLSGGSSLGAVEVGMLQALRDHGITPDMVFGASAGAINAAWVAGDPTLADVDELADVWKRLRTRDIFPLRPAIGFLGFVGRRTSLFPSDGLRRVIVANSRYERLEDAAIPIGVVATEARTGMEVVLDRGPAVEAVLASAAIPGVFPPVVIDGRALIDGGVVNNTPVSHAVDAGAERIYVLPTGYACQRERTPRGALAMTLHAVSLMVEQRLVNEVGRLQDRVDLRVLPPLCPLDVLPTDFSRAAEMIDRSRTESGKWLDRSATDGVPTDQRVNLGFHRHPTPG